MLAEAPLFSDLQLFGATKSFAGKSWSERRRGGGTKEGQTCFQYRCPIDIKPSPWLRHNSDRPFPETCSKTVDKGQFRRFLFWLVFSGRVFPSLALLFQTNPTLLMNTSAMLATVGTFSYPFLAGFGTSSSPA